MKLFDMWISLRIGGTGSRRGGSERLEDEPGAVEADGLVCLPPRDAELDLTSGHGDPLSQRTGIDRTRQPPTPRCLPGAPPAAPLFQRRARPWRSAKPPPAGGQRNHGHHHAGHRPREEGIRPQLPGHTAEETHRGPFGLQHETKPHVVRLTFRGRHERRDKPAWSRG